MIEAMNEALNYYRSPGKLTDLTKHGEEIAKLSDDVSDLVKAVQGLILHDMWLDRYGVKATEAQKCSAITPSMADIIDTSKEIEGSKVLGYNDPHLRVIACCREFSTMLCALLRAKGIPARARCGFATYLAKAGDYEDHWMCEVWDGKEWQKVDPQIDDFQLNSFKTYVKKHEDIDPEYRQMLLELDPMELTDRDFVIAGKAWQMCREGKVDPKHFGIGIDPNLFGLDSLSGLWFVKGNLIRDFLALNKIELLPFVEGIEKKKDYWNSWPIMANNGEITKEEMNLLDTLAELTLQPDKNHKEIITTYRENPELEPPQNIFK